ncbi:MAG: RnfABCDGE type electron transport complex subunit D [Candidatus Omnitrophica bacterium]|nr:RnfABCDGE type electron transport complex subunit D [Candidatus Omnitrophota bacterium]MBU0878314.1 RnfABCDGE type electron transport complex subunit D [Candidatus Omnitrophota bacterium]MBU0896810.1 RnfABCDGE type electron transport complex subunit D [Candidatus Omnitrophota bacterium]MBU1134253.1 RnfABCDGE type electron transport complex subunit D [Candidatus Omnitrophota bacterium]MBU1810420.1 RnfABCDGE type electron transport complex subunit D [Candidatus Omnitrophota bacterium]
MKLIISNSPHLRSTINTSWVMRQVIFALLPAVIASVILFKYRAIFLILNCVLTAVATESIILRIRKRPSAIKDFSAALTGLLLALILPPSTAWYAASLGSIFAILVGKQIFGGLGSNIFNPALIARAFLAAAYPKMLTTFIKPYSLDAVTAATPLALRKFSAHLSSSPTIDLFWGNTAGSLGETSAICLIVGGVYLLARKIADWRIPLSLLCATLIISSIFYFANHSNGSFLFHLFSGGLLLGAFFMATDPVTTPMTKKGRYVFGVGCAILIMITRYFSGLPEGVMYAILFMNAATPLINRLTRPRRFGE